jgi:predicted RNase H-like nuclease
MRYVGIDGCRGGWIAVAIDMQDRHEFCVFDQIDGIAQLFADRVLIDIPIGLPETGRRACDLEARRMLGAAWPRVFLDVRRPLLAFSEYAAANCWSKSDGNGISRQLWGIMPKIHKVDRFITPEAQSAIYEAHPELTFMRLNGGDAGLRHGKKTKEGRALRRELVRAAGIHEIDAWLSQLRGRGAGADDLLDACALALAAREPLRIASGGATDTRGLRMDIWY